MYELMEYQGIRFITMEYVRGENLKNMIRMSGQLSINTVIRIAKQICEGLSEAHSQKILHRDLKPSNIVIDKQGNTRIMDFGLARSIKTKGITDTGVILGTPEYMSPEQAEGKDVDQRSDIYSFGVILYEMLTGEAPFDGDSPLSIAMKHKSETPREPRAINPQIPDDLEKLVFKCMAKNRENRYQSADQILSDLIEIKKKRSDSFLTKAERKKIQIRKKSGFSLPLKKVLFPGSVFIVAALLTFLAVFLFRNSSKKPSVNPSYKQLTFTGTSTCPAISPDGKYFAYVEKESADEEIILVNTIDGNQPLEIYRGKNITKLQWLPNGSELSFNATSSTDDSISDTQIISQFGGKTRSLGRKSLLSWSPDSQHYAWGLQNIKIIQITERSSGETTEIPINFDYNWLLGLRWSPKGNFFLFLTRKGRDDNKLWTISKNGKTQNVVIESNDPIASPRWSPDGGAIYYFRILRDTQELWKIPVSPKTGKAAGKPELLVGGLNVGISLSITADGKKLLYTRALNYSNLHMVTIESSGEDTLFKVKQLTEGTSTYSLPSISPDGKSVAFTKRDNLGANIYKMPLEGGNIQQVTFMNTIKGLPVWSPDSTALAFGSIQEGNSTLWLIKVGNPSPRKVTENEMSPSLHMTWSPGSNILYQIPGNRNYISLNPITGEQIPLVENEHVGWMFFPCYSADGKKIAVAWNRQKTEGRPEFVNGLWVISFEDRSQKLIYPKPAVPLLWSQDGDWIYARISNRVEIIKVPVTGDPPISMGSLPFSNVYSLSMDSEGKRMVCAVNETQSDVWLLENFDPERN
jgi:serine/threonine protein kinase